MSMPSAPVWSLAKQNDGCKNWETVRIGPPLLLSNINICGSACRREAGCVAFNYQKSACDSKSFGEGACILYTGGCTHQINTCWDYYIMEAMPSTSTTTTTVTTTSTTSPGTTITFTTSQVTGLTVFVNELHYINTGDKHGRGVEIAGPASVDLTNYSVTCYDNAGMVVERVDFTGTIDSEPGNRGHGAMWFVLTRPETRAIALLRNAPASTDTKQVVQFISWGRTIVAMEGVAKDQTSENIGLTETDATSVGLSLQLRGTGRQYRDFRWSGPTYASPGLLNRMQTFL